MAEKFLMEIKNMRDGRGDNTLGIPISSGIAKVLGLEAGDVVSVSIVKQETLVVEAENEEK